MLRHFFVLLQNAVHKHNIIRELALYVVKLASSIHGNLVMRYLNVEVLFSSLVNDLQTVNVRTCYNDFVKLLFNSIDSTFKLNNNVTEDIAVNAVCKHANITREELNCKNGMELLKAFNKYVKLGKEFIPKHLNDEDVKYIQSTKFSYLNSILIDCWNKVYDTSFNPYYKCWWAAWIICFNVPGPVVGTSSFVHSWEANDLKKSLAFLKDKMDLSDIFSRYVGVEQCYGLQNKASEEEKRQYISEWCITEQKEAKRTRPVDRDLMSRIIDHFFTLNTQALTPDEFIKGIVWNISSGALFITRSMMQECPSIGTRITELRNLGFKVSGKKGINAVATTDEILNLLYSDKINHDVKISSAADYSKNRYIANSDIMSFIRQKLIMDRFKYRYENYKAESVPEFVTKNGFKLHLNLTNSVKYHIHYANMYCWDSVTNENTSFAYVPMDYEKFDFNPTDTEVYEFVRLLGEKSGMSELAELWIAGQSRGEVIMEGSSIGTYKNGILSGWYLTNMLDSLMNIYWFVYVLERSNFDFLDKCIVSVMGDDVDLRIRGQMDKAMDLKVKQFLSRFGEEFKLRLHPMKTSMRIFRSEYLKTLTGFCSQYGARALHSLINRNEKNSTELFDALIDSKGGNYEIFTRWNNVLLRGGNPNNIEKLMLMEYEYVLGWKLHNKLNSVYRYLYMMQRDGGLGISSDLIQKKVANNLHNKELLFKSVSYEQDSSKLSVLRSYLTDKLGSELADNIIKTGAVTFVAGEMYRLKRSVKKMHLFSNSLQSTPLSISEVNNRFLKPLKARGSGDFEESPVIVGLRSMMTLRRKGYSDEYIASYLKRHLTLRRREIRELLQGLIKDDSVSLQLVFGLGNNTTALISKAKLLAGRHAVRGRNRISGCSAFTGRVLNLLL